KPFLNMALSDCTQTIDAQIWDYTGPVTPKDTGAVVKIRGVVSEFKGTLQITVDRLRLADSNDQYNISDLVPTAPIDVETTWQKLQEIVDSIEDQDYLVICKEMLRRYGESVKQIPAAKSVHHGFLNGLLMHTAYMLQTADFLAGMYKSVLDRSLLLAGTLLHDFAKCEEFTTSPLGLVTEYSMKGQLLGHLVMGAQEVANVSSELRIPEEKSVLLQHLILSHHGEPEFGAAVLPICAEGELLSFLDKIDSRMEIYRETLEEIPAGEFSKRIFALDRRIYHHN
ncbi:MAG: HD domain-containing protein, partial [Lawsonibacter sp.]|nr:HD domain-containing protein [Lawsonibacter sp.]